MAGTVKGGKKAAATNRIKYGDGTDGRPDFFKTIGSAGGKAGNPATKGFASNRELAREAGRKGGVSGSRGVAKKKPLVQLVEQTQSRQKEMNTGGFWDKFRRFQS